MIEHNSETLLSVRAASFWLKARGVKAHTRHMVYAALARGRLPVAATADRMLFVRERDLEKYAQELTAERAEVTSEQAV